MTYVIAEPCVGVKDGSCADVCPVECIHTSADTDMYFIDSIECIDCGVCVPACPVTAIYPDYELPDPWDRFTDLNDGFFRSGGSGGSPVPRTPLPPHLPGGAEAQF